jgi:histidinol-phosphate aminotransferase
MRTKVSTLVQSHAELLQKFTSLAPLGLGGAIGGDDANFILVPVLTKDGSGKPDSERAQRVYKTLAEENGVVVRYRGGEMGCQGCLRITVGTEEENEVVLGLSKLGEVLRVI